MTNNSLEGTVLKLDADPRFNNPFEEIDEFEEWLITQDEVRRLLTYLQNAGVEFTTSPWKGYYKNIIQGVLSMPLPPPPVFVFGSNQSGIHGAGAALFANKYHEAVIGVGEGRTGNTYALPTKSHPNTLLTLEEIQEKIITFITYAKHHPEETYNVTRIGTGLAGYRDDQIQSLFRTAFTSVGKPNNIVLPYTWNKDSGKAHRVIVAGSRHFNDPRYIPHIERQLNKLKNVDRIIVGGARGIDTLAEQVAIQTGRHFDRYPAWWELYGKSAGYVRNGVMAQHASACVAVWDEKSRGTGSMIKITNDYNLELILSIDPFK